VRVLPETLTQMKKLSKKSSCRRCKILRLNYSFRSQNTDEEIAHGMELAKALGTR